MTFSPAATARADRGRRYRRTPQELSIISDAVPLTIALEFDRVTRDFVTPDGGSTVQSTTSRSR